MFSKAVLLDPGGTQHYNRAVLEIGSVRLGRRVQEESRKPHSALCEVEKFDEEDNLCPHTGGST